MDINFSLHATKIHRNFRCFRAGFLLKFICIIIPSWRAVKNPSWRDDIESMKGNSREVNAMTNTVAVSKDKLKGIFDTDSLTGTAFKVTITPISEEEAEEIQFKSLKGIAGRPLDADEVRRERLGL